MRDGRRMRPAGHFLRGRTLQIADPRRGGNGNGGGSATRAPGACFTALPEGAEGHNSHPRGNLTRGYRHPGGIS